MSSPRPTTPSPPPSTWRLLVSRLVWLTVIVAASLVYLAVPWLQDAFADGAVDAGSPASIYDLEARRLGGEVEPLDRYRGRVLLVVNTASKCGYTPQYEQLQSLYSEQQERGLTVLGFPSNDFANQEPGSDAQIGAFCKKNYGVDFPMFSKVHVNGPGAHPVYAFLTSQPPPVGGPVEWNFQKYLVDREGKVVKRFHPRVEPTSRAFRDAVERLLAEPAADAGSTGEARG